MTTASHPEHAERLQQVDASNAVLGELPRGEIHGRGLKHRSVHVAIFDARGCLFLQRRAADKPILADHWDISAAGHVDPGESYPAAAARELREELGIAAELAPVQVSDASPKVGNEFAALYWGVADKPASIRPCAKEIAESGFLSPAELLERLRDPGAKIVPSLLHILRTLMDHEEAVEPFRKWEPAERSAVREAIREHAGYPGDIGAHGPSAGLLAEGPGSRGGVWPGVQKWLEKAIFACLAACLFAGALFYPLILKEDSLDSLRRTGADLAASPSALGRLGGRLLMGEIHPFVSGTLTPLPLKEAALGFLILAALPLFVALALLRPATSLFKRPLVLVPLILACWAGASLRLVLPSDWMYLGAEAAINLWLFLGLAAMSATVLATKARQRRMLFLAMVPLATVALIALAQRFGKVALLPRGETERNLMASTIGHNNGVASLLLYLWFPCLAALFLSRRGLARSLALAGTLALLFVFLYLQTRAVWAILAVLTPPFLWLAAKQAGWKPRLAHVLGAVAVVAAAMLAQAIDKPWNPFRADPPLVQRLRELKPSKLRQTTQARILSLAAPYMAEDAKRFAFGTGVGSFKAVYPRMQAEYYADRDARDMPFYLPSDKRTARAHSDALQLLIELGAVGLLLLFAFLWLFAKHAEKAWNLAPGPRERLWLLAIFFPLAGTMLHGIVEFPFHVASTMAYFCVFLGMAFAAPEAWGRPRLNPRPAPNLLQRGLASGSVAGTAFRIAFLCCVLALGVLAAGAMAMWTGRRLIADHYQKTSDSLAQSYYADPGQRLTEWGDQTLARARTFLQAAFRFAPGSDPELHLRRGSLHSMIAHVLAVRGEQAQRSGKANPEALALMRDQALWHMRQAVAEMERAQQGGAEYFKTHFELALARQGLADLEPDPEAARENERLMVEELRLSHRFNPMFDNALVYLLERFERERPAQDPELSRWRALLLRSSPERYAERYLEPLGEAMKNGDFARARWFLAVERLDQPAEPIYHFSEALLLARQGKGAEALAVLKGLKKQFPDFALYPDIAAVAALAARDWKEARRFAEEALAAKNPASDVPMLETIRARSAEGAGDPDAPQLWSKVRRLAMEDVPKHSAPWLDAVANVLHVYLGETGRALPFMRRRATIFEPRAPDTLILAPLARDAAARDALDEAREYLKEALVGQPGNREIQALVEETFGAGDSAEADSLRAEAAEERRARDYAERKKSFQAALDSQGF